MSPVDSANLEPGVVRNGIAFSSLSSAQYPGSTVHMVWQPGAGFDPEGFLKQTGLSNVTVHTDAQGAVRASSELTPEQYEAIAAQYPALELPGLKDGRLPRPGALATTDLGEGNAVGLVLPQTLPMVTLETVVVRPDASDPETGPETDAEVTSVTVAKEAAKGIGKGVVSAVTGMVDTAKLTGEGLWYLVSQPVETGKALVWGAGEASDALGDWAETQLFPVIYEIQTNPGEAWDAAKMMGSDMADYASQHPDRVAHGAGEVLGNLAGGAGIGWVGGKAGTLLKGVKELPKSKPVWEEPKLKPKPAEQPKPEPRPAEQPKPKEPEGGYVKKQPKCFKPQKLPKEKLPELDR